MRQQPKLRDPSEQNLTSGSLGSYAVIFEEADAVRLLKAAVDKAGGQSAFARRHRIDRVSLNRILNGKRPLYGAFAKAIRLRRVFVRD